MAASEPGAADGHQKFNFHTLVPAAALPLRTEGRYLVGANSARVRLYCVNWYGAHMKQMVAAGLQYLRLKEVAERIVSLGFNCVRLPYSLDLLMSNTTAVPHPHMTLAANPDLQGKSPLQVFDAAIEVLTGEGILVILNNHVSSKMWCCSTWDGEGLWRTEEYPEEMWFRGLQLAAARYAGNSRVAGFDLRNEPRRSSLGYPAWGHTESGEAIDDWSLAAASGGKLVAELNPHMLVIVSAVNFPMLLCHVGQNMLHLTEPALKGRLVYTVHEYSWWSFDLLTHEALGYLLPYLVLLAIVTLVTLMCVPQAKLFHRTKLLWFLTGAAGSCTAFLFAAIVSSEVMQQSCSPNSFMGSVIFLFAPYLMATLTGLAWTSVVSALLWHALCSWRCSSCTTRDSVPTQVQSEDVGRDRRRPRTVARRHQVALAIGVCSVLMLLELVRENTGLYASFKADLDRRWGFILNGETAAPVWIGEFGTAKDNLWWEYFRRYLLEADLDWAYWAFNGEKEPHKQERYGLLLDDWKTIRHPWKLEHLQMLINAREGTEGGWNNSAASYLQPLPWVI